MVFSPTLSSSLRVCHFRFRLHCAARLPCRVWQASAHLRSTTSVARWSGHFTVVHLLFCLYTQRTSKVSIPKRKSFSSSLQKSKKQLRVSVHVHRCTVHNKPGAHDVEPQPFASHHTRPRISVLLAAVHDKIHMGKLWRRGGGGQREVLEENQFGMQLAQT